ncbi:MAG: trimethylamine methyltransferase family protein [Gemmatimonadota bacterium]
MAADRWRPALAGPWQAADLEAVAASALRLLEEIGVDCRHPAARQRLEEWGAVATGDRVRFPAARVRRHLEQVVRVGEPAGTEPEFALGGCWACLFYCDPETQQVRPAASAEAAQMARLWDARGLSGVVPLVPGDVPPALVTLAAERLALRNSRGLGGGLTATDPEEIRVLRDMNLAAGRRYRLMTQVGISPLKLNAEALEAGLQFLGDPGVEVSLAGAIPMAGATCPLDPRAAVAQSLAEELALDVLKVALGQPGGGLGLRVEPFDFQYATIVFGSPEWCLYRALVLQLLLHLTGRPVRQGSFRSTAKQPDEQAAAERAASALWQALLGVRRFGAVGQLSVDEVFSPQQAVLDREILRYVARVARGLDAGPGGDPVTLVRAGVEAGSFAGLPETAEGFREIYDFPDIFRHWNAGRWRSEGGRSVLEEAWSRARAEIGASTYHLEPDAARRVEEAYRCGAEHLRGRS